MIFFENGGREFLLCVIVYGFNVCGGMLRVLFRVYGVCLYVFDIFLGDKFLVVLRREFRW